MALFVLREVVKSFAVYSAKITLYRLTLRNFRQGARGGRGIKKTLYDTDVEEKSRVGAIFIDNFPYDWQYGDR